MAYQGAARALLLCIAGTTLFTQAWGASLDTEKLRLLSCVVPAPSTATADQRAAMRWLYAAGNTTDGMSFNVAGPLKLGKTCLRNLKVNLGAAWKAEGEVCNPIEEFSSALGEAGIVLTGDAASGFQSRDKSYQYELKALTPGAGAFSCSASKPAG